MKNNIRKSIKKWLAFAMTAIMAFAMATTVMATDSGLNGNYSITITNGSGNTYSLYQIATYDVSKVDGALYYTGIKVNSAYSEVIKDDNMATIAAYGESSAEAQALAVSLYAKASGDTPVASGVTDGSITGLVTGYYLLVETAHDSSNAATATQYCLINVDGYDSSLQTSTEETVTLKTSQPTLTKKIVVGDGDEGRVDVSVAGAGDDVVYELKTTIPTYSSDATNLKFEITDELSEGLDYKSVSLTVGGSGVSAAVDTYSVDSTTVEHTVTISFANDYILAHGGEDVVVTLTATLNSSAVIGSTGNPNSASLEYTTNWNTKSTNETKKDSVITYIGAVKIHKVDENTQTTNLSGAVFAIYGPDSSKQNATVPTGASATIGTAEGLAETYYYYGSTAATDDDGLTTFSGLDKGTYYAVEITAPSGYNIVSDPQKLELTVKVYDDEGNGSEVATETKGELVVTNGNSSTTTEYIATWYTGGKESVTITNKKGTTLPGTGGIGTTLFTFGGLALVILAAIMFIVYTKKQRKQA